jgi:hypothetical protein
MENKSDYYKEEFLKSMIFSYTIKKGKAKEKIASNNIDLEFQNYKHHKLPITMNPLEYGELLEQDDNKFTVQVNKTNVVIIRKYEQFNEVKFFKEGKIAYIYKDHKIDENTFIRSIENKKYTFKNKNVILLVIDKSVNFIKSLILNNKLNNKFITFDIETYVKDGIMIPFVIS